MKSHFQKMHDKRNCVIIRSCADSNVPLISQDQYVLMQKLFTMTNVTKLYMFLIATKDHFCLHGNQWHDFNSDMTYDKQSYICFYSTYICKIGMKLKFIEQPLLFYQRMRAHLHIHEYSLKLYFLPKFSHYFVIKI